MTHDPDPNEQQEARLREALARLRLIAHQDEEAVAALASQMRGAADTPEARRSDEMATAALARVARSTKETPHYSIKP
jgi:hypothetical protein